MDEYYLTTFVVEGWDCRILAGTRYLVQLKMMMRRQYACLDDCSVDELVVEDSWPMNNVVGERQSVAFVLVPVLQLKIGLHNAMVTPPHVADSNRLLSNRVVSFIYILLVYLHLRLLT